MNTKLETISPLSNARALDEHDPIVIAPMKNEDVVLQTPRSAWQIGHGRPALEVEDLPTPEQVFGSHHIGIEELILLVIGPGIIALGFAVGSGELLIGPFNIVRYGLQGIGIMAFAALILQIFHNVEMARFTLATGEPPVVAFHRIIPRYIIWLPLGLIMLYPIILMGKWTVSAGVNLFALLFGRANIASEQETVRLLGIFILVVAFALLMFGRKVERTLETMQFLLLPYTFLGILFVTLIVVPPGFWIETFREVAKPIIPTENIDLKLLSNLVGIFALMSCLNFMCVGYYRDKGFGMGSKIGFIGGLIFGQAGRKAYTGKTFPENSENAIRWRRWFRLLLIDQWAVYFPGLLIGILLTGILVAYLAKLSGVILPEQSSVFLYISQQLGRRYGRVLAGWASLTGIVILFSALMLSLELISRTLSEMISTHSKRIGDPLHNDTRKLVYPVMAFVVLIVSLLAHVEIPNNVFMIAAYVTGSTAIIFPLLTVFLNRQLPKPARISWWSYLVPLAYVGMIGLFFAYFMKSAIIGAP